MFLIENSYLFIFLCYSIECYHIRVLELSHNGRLLEESHSVYHTCIIVQSLYGHIHRQVWFLAPCPLVNCAKLT